MIRLTIPYPPGKKGKSAFCKRYGLNAYYAGKHWAKRKEDAQTLHALATAAMRRAGVKKQFAKSPVEITFLWDDGLDIDNHAVLGKAFVDAMKGYIFPDDNRKWVHRISHEFWDGGAMLVEVREIE